MAKKEKRDVLVSYDLLPIFKELINTKRERVAAELVIAIIEFDKDGVEPSFSDDNVNFTWKTMIQPLLNKNKQRYKKTCEERTKAVNARYNKSSDCIENEQENTNATNDTKATNEYKCSENIQENTNATDYDVDYDVDVDKENNIKEIQNDLLEVIKVWENKFGPVSSTRYEQLKDLLSDYGKDITIYAICQGGDYGHSGISYLRSVARNESRRRNGAGKANNGAGITDPYLQQLYAEDQQRQSDEIRALQDGGENTGEGVRPAGSV